MASSNQVKILTTLQDKKIKFITDDGIRTLFNIANSNTQNKLIQRLIKSNIIYRVMKGKYVVRGANYRDFELANFIINPSYVSFETALNLYGILSQFPYTTTSLTIGRSKSIIFNDKEFEYIHLDPKYYWGFEKVDNCLVAKPEKALIDTLYFCTKGLRRLDLEELDFSVINKKLLNQYLKKFGKDEITKMLRHSKLI